MHQAGLIDKAARKARNKTKNRCSTDSKNKENKSIMLKILDFSVAFLVLGTGYGCAIVVLIGELVINMILKRMV